jgi:SAM-dependent methyltransferase
MSTAIIEPMSDPQRLPESLEGFYNFHEGETILVCGCGSSLTEVAGPERFITIGVNDVGRMFQPDYLVVLNSRPQFSHDRYRHVEESRARAVFTQLRLGLSHPHVITFRLGRRGGTDVDGATLPYTRNSPYVALALAMHMGARRIGLIGVDFTENHFFGRTGRHPLSRELPQIDGEYTRLAEACRQRGVELFNLSATSRLTGLPKMSFGAFAAAVPRPALRIVSYATTPVAGVPPILARSIAAQTANECRTVWSDRHYGNGVTFDGDVEYKRDPGKANELLAGADLVVLHNGKVAPQHERLLAGKPVLTLAHNYKWNVDSRWVDRGFPGLVVAQYQASLKEFDRWTPVPNPVPLWEAAYQPAAKESPLTICYTPSGKHEAYPFEHRLYWHSKGYATTRAVLERLAARYPLRLEIIRTHQISHAESLAMKRRAHIVIDECVTGSYHRNSLEGLAAGAVVVNGLGIRPEIAGVLSRCTSEEAGNPFVFADLSTLEATLAGLIEEGEEALLARGAAGRRWMEEQWDFGRQWSRFWEPAVDRALAHVQRPRVAPRPAAVAAPAPVPQLPRALVRQTVAAHPRPAPQPPRLAAAPPAMSSKLDDVSIIVPHGGAERLRNLRVTLEAIKAAGVIADVVVMEMDSEPRAREIVAAAGFRYVFAEQDGSFHKARVMNAGVPFVRSSRFFWIDSDLLVSAPFLRNAVAEFEARKLDCLVPWSSVHYLGASDSEAVAAGTRDPAACTPVNTYHTRGGGRGGVLLVRTEFVRRYGGVCEEFRGWGGEDNAWFLKAAVLGRAAATSRPDQYIYHVYHELSGGYGPPAAMAANPNYQRNLALLYEVRRLTTRDRFLRRFPAPNHFPAPWLGVRRVACGAGAEAVGEALRELYGPAVEICAEGQPVHTTVTAADLADTTAMDVAREIAARVVFGEAIAVLPPRPRVEVELSAEDSALAGSWPWKTDSVDALRAHDVIGFLPDTIHTMNELWRVLRDGATAELSVLTTDGPGAFADPKLVTFWNRQSFDWFEEGNAERARCAARYGITARFRIAGERTEPTPRGPRLIVELLAVKDAREES